MTKKKEKKLPPGVRLRNGRYTFRYSVEIVIDGKTERKQKETPAYATSQEAYDAGTLIRAQQIQGVYIDETIITFKDWSEKWIVIYEESGKKRHSVKSRKTSLSRLVERFGHMKLKDIKAMQYQGFLFELKREGLTKNTILALHSTMSLLFKKAYLPPYELIARDITKDIELPAFNKTSDELEQELEFVKYLEKDELNVFLKACWDKTETYSEAKEQLIARQCARALEILAYTGLRIGELCALERNRIDEVNKQLRISKTLYVMDGIEQYELGTPKNKKARYVDVTKKVLGYFSEQERERKQLQLLSSSYYRGRELVFASAKRKPGYPLSPRDIEVYMNGVLEESNLPSELTPHSLRHTFTSLAAEAGIELPAIQRQLGHLNDKTTTQIYLHVTKARRRADVEKLEALIDE